MVLSRLPRNVLISVLSLFVLWVAVATGLVRELDRSWFGERLMDARGAIEGSEDWKALEPMAPGLRYDWLQVKPPDVAHALGASGTPLQNTLPAAAASAASGMHLLEVDIWLADDDSLRCHHGPGAPGKLHAGDCTFDALLHWMAGRDVWLVLDIKTDFVRTGDRIMRELARTDTARRIIFQLYKPAHVGHFERWRKEADLAGPIVTAYLSRRSLDHQLTGAAAAGAHAFVFPLERAAALSVRPAGVALFVHPVHDCASLAQSESLSVHGVFRISTLQCNAKQ